LHCFHGCEVVHDHGIAGTTRGTENLLDLEPEAVAIDRSVEKPGGEHEA
jgi:hypothetical protein